MLDKLYDSWKTSGTPDDFRALLDATRDRQEKAITTYVGTGDNLLRMKARVLTAQALKKYDPQKGTKLDTYLMSQLQPLSRFQASREILRIPEGARQALTRTKQVESELTAELGREPTLSELSYRAGLPVKRVRDLQMKYRTATPESMLTSPEGEPLLPETKTVNPRLNAWADYVYSGLDKTGQTIMEMSGAYGSRKPVGTGEIARHLGLSASAVSQRMKNIGDQLLQGEEYYGKSS